MLQENREGRVAPRQSSSFKLLQEALEAEERGEARGGRSSGAEWWRWFWRGSRFPRTPLGPGWTAYWPSDS